MEENQNVVSEQQPQPEQQPQQPQPEQQQQYNQQQQGQPYGQPVQESRVGIGVLLGVFTGLLGLLIGYLIFKDKPYEWKTFLKGWLWAFFISLGVAIVCAIIGFVLYGAGLMIWARGIGGGMAF